MLVALLTDFGLADTYVGVMHAIIATLAPGVSIVDLTHAIPPQDVAAGCWQLATAAPYLPEEAVICAVVDPGVGTMRRAIAVQIGPRIYVAPDNGLLTRVMARDPVTAAVTLNDPAVWLQRDGLSLSATFHGRDIFAPVAGRLAHGLPLAAAGTAIDPASLARLSLPQPTRQGDSLIAHIIHIDHFGNLITDLGPDEAPDLFAAPHITASIGAQTITARAATFGQGPDGEPFWYLDSSGHAGIAVKNGDAARALGARVGDSVRIQLSF